MVNYNHAIKIYDLKYFYAWIVFEILCSNCQDSNRPDEYFSRLLFCWYWWKSKAENILVSIHYWKRFLGKCFEVFQSSLQVSLPEGYLFHAEKYQLNIRPGTYHISIYNLCISISFQKMVPVSFCCKDKFENGHSFLRAI